MGAALSEEMVVVVHQLMYSDRIRQLIQLPEFENCQRLFKRRTRFPRVRCQ